LKELNSKSYTVAGNNSGSKPHRECRVSLSYSATSVWRAQRQVM
jgi:hypothetical protein